MEGELADIVALWCINIVACCAAGNVAEEAPSESRDGTPVFGEHVPAVNPVKLSRGGEHFIPRVSKLETSDHIWKRFGEIVEIASVALKIYVMQLGNFFLFIIVINTSVS